MTIARMTLCQWRGARAESEVVTRPTLEQVVEAVRRLDNGAFNDLYLEPDGSADDTRLCVGGGAGRYVLSGAVSNERFPTLVDPARQAEPAEALVVGGLHSMWFERFGAPDVSRVPAMLGWTGDVLLNERITEGTWIRNNYWLG